MLGIKHKKLMLGSYNVSEGGYFTKYSITSPECDENMDPIGVKVLEI